MKIGPAIVLLLLAVDTQWIRYFQRVSCNDKLSTAICKSWQQVFGTLGTFSRRVVIPCDACVLFDSPRESSRFTSGLDIQGKLVVVSPTNDDRKNDDHICFDHYCARRTRCGYTQDETRCGWNTISEVLPLTWETEELFSPIGENENACFGSPFCLAGKKSITVAGGQVTLRGIPDGTPSWVKLYDVVSTNGNDPRYVDCLFVSNAVQDTWAAGAEILITSHTSCTRDWDGHQQRTIVGISDDSRDGYVELQLDRPVIRPIKMRNDRNFAVEVALLSRNILFDAMLSSWADHGGHFWVFHTPRIHQLIEGVAIRNFGQQGTLRRYTSHFHVCGDVSGSVADKNTIRINGASLCMLRTTCSYTRLLHSIRKATASCISASGFHWELPSQLRF